MSSSKSSASIRTQSKAETHRRIVAAASRLIRGKGLAAASVIRVMRAAGLTAGGFYAHFRSKFAMDVEVLRSTLADTRAKWFGGLDSSSPRDWIGAVVTRYLSPAHRDRFEDGCPLPAVLSELSRSDKRTRQAMADGMEAYIQEFVSHAPEIPGVNARERALATLALCVGGLALARAMRGLPESEEVLHACTKWALPDQ
ncbi:MAG: TetR/AcrR family transcriptional regulator [Bryobacteraceae bacterium]|jgi:TetR/AcrR family transcriptional repressor of nem operon